MKTLKQKIKSIIPQITKHLVYSTIAILVGVTSVYAIGSLTPTGTPGDDTQYSLNDIYTRLTTNATATEGSGAMIVPGSVTATFRTLTEIYNAIPTIDPTKVAVGTTYLGVDGTKEDGVIYPTEWSAEYPDGYVTWQQAMDYCDVTLGDGWRLPTYIELVNAYLTAEAGFQSDYYWSSTEYPSDPGNAYFVGMSVGSAGYNDKTDPFGLARCAR